MTISDIGNTPQPPTDFPDLNYIGAGWDGSTDRPTNDRADCVQTVQTPDGLTAWGTERGGFRVLVGGAEVAHYRAEPGLDGYGAIERYRRERIEAQRMKALE